MAVVLSGMSTLDQVKENLALTKNSLAKSLTEDEHRLIQRVIDLYKQKSRSAVPPVTIASLVHRV